LPGGPAAGEFVVVIQGRTTVEAHFAVPFRGGQAASTLAVLASDVRRVRSEPPHEPPYPRPEFHSLEELAAVLAEVVQSGLPGGSRRVAKARRTR